MFDSDNCLHEFQSNYPARVKQLHVYNVGALVDFLMTVVKFCMPEKLQQRVRPYVQRMKQPISYCFSRRMLLL